MPFNENAGYLTRPLPLIDAVNWPGTVAVTQTYAYDSRDGQAAGTGDGSYTTITGTATFSWTRVTLASLLVSPDLPCVSTSGLTVPDQQFLAVQCALGNLPGWVVTFGNQPTQKGAFTRIQYPGSNTPSTTNPDGTTTAAQPVTTLLDADAGVSMTCAPCAPGRFVSTEYNVGDTLYTSISEYAGGAFASINQGLTGDPQNNVSTSTPCGLTLLQAGVPADPTTGQPEIAPVYRVSIPTDAAAIGGLSLTLNGVTGNGLPEPNGDVGNGALPGALVDAAGFIGGLTTIPRSPWVCDVQCNAASDVLSDVTLSGYAGSTPADSTVSYGGPVATIDDPFNLPGQSFTDTSAKQSQGFTVMIQF